MTKKKDLTGKIIKFSKIEVKFLDNFTKQKMIGYQLQESGAQVVIEAKRALWETISDLRPGIEEYHSTYNTKDGELRVLAKKSITRLED